MVKVIVVKKSGTFKIDNYDHENDEKLYKVAGLKNSNDFECVATWNMRNEKNNMYDYCVYAKKTGNAGQENKYDFPPPIDSDLFFGSCIILKKNNESYKSIRLEEWDFIYESLFGGFEDIGEYDSEDEDEEDELDDDVEFTKSGYVQDGFVVDDDEPEDEDASYEEGEYEEEEDEEEEDEEEEEEEEELDEAATDAAVNTTVYNTRSQRGTTTVFLSLEHDIDSELTE